jgi:hypothetical protein
MSSVAPSLEAIADPAEIAACHAPFRGLPGMRRCLFVEDELHRYPDSAPLEVVKLADGGKLVRPKRANHCPRSSRSPFAGCGASASRAG